MDISGNCDGFVARVDVEEEQMSAERILGQFCKSGDWNKYSRRFHALDRNAKLKAIEAIQNGSDPDKAIRKAKRGGK